jgi:hypothetical protein
MAADSGGCKITSGTDGEFGAVRTVGAEVLVGRTELSYTYAQTPKEGTRYNLYHGTLEARPVTPTTSKIVYTLFFDNSMLPDDAARAADKERRRIRFMQALQNMKTLVEGGKLNWDGGASEYLDGNLSLPPARRAGPDHRLPPPAERRKAALSHRDGRRKIRPDCPVHSLVSWWAAEGRDLDRARRALRLQRLKLSDREDPFGAIIRCTADPAKADKRTRSKWSRVMRYAAAYKPDSEPLDQFVD